MGQNAPEERVEMSLNRALIVGSLVLATLPAAVLAEGGRDSRS